MGNPTKVHAMVISLGRKCAAMDHELGRWLVAAYRLRVHESLGFASFAEYVERYCGCSRREATERLRVAKTLDELPELSHALRTGQVCWSACRELSRVANEETEREWLDAALGCTARQVERMVVGREKGSRPLDRPSAEPPRKLVLEVSAPTWALFREAREAMTAERGGRVDDDEVVAAFAGAVLAGASRDEGRAAYQIALTICDRCQTVSQRAGADDVVVDEVALEVAQCDAQHVGRVDHAGEMSKATQTVPPRTRRNVALRHGKRCAVPGCRHAAFVELHHTTRRVDGGDHDPEKLVPLCHGHHTATHVGALVIAGTYSTGFTFTHADGAPYGAPFASPARSKMLAQAHEALVGWGFKQREAQALIDAARSGLKPDADVPAIVRSALAHARLPAGIVAREELYTYERLVA